MPASKPVQRTLEAFRKFDFVADVAEKWVELPGKERCPACGRAKSRRGFPPGIRMDLHGFVDIVAYKPGAGIFYVQACPDQHVAEHLTKLLGEKLFPKIESAVLTGIHVEIWGWAQRGPWGKKVWSPRRKIFQEWAGPVQPNPCVPMIEGGAGKLAWFEVIGIPTQEAGWGRNEPAGS